MLFSDYVLSFQIIGFIFILIDRVIPEKYHPRPGYSALTGCGIMLIIIGLVFSLQVFQDKFPN